jgi:CubicO group peptidase (beta-lactamase class C family)
MLLNKGKYKDKLFLSEKTIENLSQNYAPKSDKARSLGWDLIEYENRYLLYHTGYTGTFMILDILAKEGFIFLSNRVHPVDRRDDYLKVRDKLVNIYLAERQEKE